MDGIHMTASNQTFFPVSPVQSERLTAASWLLLKENLPRFAQLPEPTSVIAFWLTVAWWTPSVAVTWYFADDVSGVWLSTYGTKA